MSFVPKDERVLRLAASHNVARFVSFGPDRSPRFYGTGSDYRPETIGEAACYLSRVNPEKTVGARTFSLTEDAKGTPLIIGHSVEETVARAESCLSEGLGVILSESFDPARMSVSGVLQDNVAEFAPGHTPRCVETQEVCSLPRREAENMLAFVYGDWRAFWDGISRDRRVEWCLCDSARGTRQSPMVFWDDEPADLSCTVQPTRQWPNLMSESVGDKVFGLMMTLIARGLTDGVLVVVPWTLVVGRYFAPFWFGDRPFPYGPASTGVWTRTSPARSTPGKFTTARSWRDPFALLQAEDPAGDRIASVMCQSHFESAYAGAAATTADGRVVVEGSLGLGDAFMLGGEPRPLPRQVENAVQRVARSLFDKFPRGVHFEWGYIGPESLVDSPWNRDAYDRRATYPVVAIFQLHHRSLPEGASVLGSPGVGGNSESRHWIYPPPEGGLRETRVFEAGRPLEELRQLVAAVHDQGEPYVGIEVRGSVGLLSHVGDVLRKARVPSYRVSAE